MAGTEDTLFVAPSEGFADRPLPAGGPPRFDWSLGQYERTAAGLEPVAAQVIRRAALGEGEDVLDLGCGTGNAAVLAARAGARVIGLDAASRLVQVARSRAAAERLPATFLEGDFHSLDFPASRFDAVVSVFAAIFGDPKRILPEVLRVLRPGGRVVLAAWLPAGTMDAMIAGIMTTMSEVSGMSFPPPFPWHDPQALGPFVEPHGMSVSAEDGELFFTADSPEAFWEEQQVSPQAMSTRGLLEHFGVGARLQEQSLAILRQGNEDPAAFRITLPYRILEISPEA
jgi:SAM-dependent methyltransferase